MNEEEEKNLPTLETTIPSPPFPFNGLSVSRCYLLRKEGLERVYI
jgi:hypothetical protein